MRSNHGQYQSALEAQEGIQAKEGPGQQRQGQVFREARQLSHWPEINARAKGGKVSGNKPRLKIPVEQRLRGVGKIKQPQAKVIEQPKFTPEQEAARRRRPI